MQTALSIGGRIHLRDEVQRPAACLAGRRRVRLVAVVVRLRQTSRTAMMKGRRQFIVWERATGQPDHARGRGALATSLAQGQYGMTRVLIPLQATPAEARMNGRLRWSLRTAPMTQTATHLQLPLTGKPPSRVAYAGPRACGNGVHRSTYPTCAASPSSYPASDAILRA